MTPEDRDRAAREIEELRQLFSPSGRSQQDRRVDARTRPTGVEDAETDAGTAEVADDVGTGAATEEQHTAKRETSARQRPSVQDRTVRAVEPPSTTGGAEERVPVWEPAPRNGGSARRTSASPPPRAKDPPVRVFDKALADAQEPAPAGPAARPVASRVLAEQQTGPKSPRKEEPGGGPERRRSLRWVAVLLLPVLLAASFAAGLGIGRKRHSPAVTAPTPVSASTVAPTSASPPPAPSPNACLDTARYGDQVIALLTANIRDQRINDPMRNYAKSSQACRAAASVP